MLVPFKPDLQRSASGVVLQAKSSRLSASAHPQLTQLSFVSWAWGSLPSPSTLSLSDLSVLADVYWPVIILFLGAKAPPSAGYSLHSPAQLCPGSPCSVVPIIAFKSYEKDFGVRVLKLSSDTSHNPAACRLFF